MIQQNKIGKAPPGAATSENPLYKGEANVKKAENYKRVEQSFQSQKGGKQARRRRGNE